MKNLVCTSIDRASKQLSIVFLLIVFGGGLSLAQTLRKPIPDDQVTIPDYYGLYAITSASTSELKPNTAAKELNADVEFVFYSKSANRAEGFKLLKIPAQATQQNLQRNTQKNDGQFKGWADFQKQTEEYTKDNEAILSGIPRGSIEIELRAKSISGQPEMVRFIPVNTLEPGDYQYGSLGRPTYRFFVSGEGKTFVPPTITERARRTRETETQAKADAGSTVSSVASGGSWKSPLLIALKSQYEITTRDWLGKVQKPGMILLVAQDGIQADEPKAVMKPTIIENGKIVKSGGGTMLTGSGGRSLKQGEKVYVYDIRVHEDYVLFIVATVNTVDIVQRGKTRSVAQEASLSFRLNKAETPTPESVFALIKQWLVTENESVSTKTVSLGQTIEEVEKALGKPSKVAKLEAKSIYYYTDMKVVFVDGKVTDVQ